MALLKRQKRSVPRAGPFPPGWDVPAAFNFTRDVVEAHAADPLRSALTFVDHEGIVDRRTFAEIAGDAARWAHLLRTRLDRGDRVLVVVGNVPAWVGAMLGAIKGGLVAVPCPPVLRARDLAFRVKDSGARLIIADRACEPEIEEMRNQIGDIVNVLYVDEALAEITRYRPVAPTEETTAGETALILYTSGTTKEPKGVVHTHAYTWAQRQQAAQWLDANDRDVVWCTASTGWAKAIWNVLLGPWSHRAEVVLHENPFDPEERLSLVQKLGVTVLCQAPTEYRMLAKLDTLSTTYLPKLRHLVSAGEPLNPEVIARFQDALGLTVHDGYGQTENSVLVANIPGAPIRPGSMGMPTEGHDVAVIDEAGNVCAPGVEGDIALQGRPPTLFSGYWNNRDETNAVFRDGWYLTGDRGTRDDEGYMWFVGRTDDVILSSAYRIGPFEVESALLEHPAVAESAVVGVPDADRGQIVKAFVVLRDGHEPGDDIARELQEHVKAVTAPYKYPRAISFVDDLPKSTSGKLRRTELRELDGSVETYAPSAVVVPLRPVAAPAAAEEPDDEERREAEAKKQARIAAAEADRARVEAEVAARRAAEEADRARREAEEIVRREAEAKARDEAVERARREAQEAEQRRAEAEAEARAQAEAAEAAEAQELAEAERREAEAAEHARAEAEAAAGAEEAERREAEARAQAEAEALAREQEEQARLEAEAAERARLEAEAAAQAEREQLDAEEAERARLAAEAAALEVKERAWREAKEQQWRAAQEQAALRAAEDAAHARAETETLDLDDLDDDEVEVGSGDAGSESWRDGRRRKREEAARLKAEAEEDKRRAKLQAEQQKQAEIDAREDAKRRAIEEKEAAKQRAEEEKLAAQQRVVEERRRAEEEKLAAKQRAEDERRHAKEAEEQRKRDEAAAREDAKRRAAEEREAAKQLKAAARPKRGFLGGRDDEEDDEPDDTPVAPIPDIVERLQRYSGAVDLQSPENGTTSFPDDLVRHGFERDRERARESEPEQADERRSMH